MSMSIDMVKNFLMNISCFDQSQGLIYEDEAVIATTYIGPLTLETKSN